MGWPHLTFPVFDIHVFRLGHLGLLTDHFSLSRKTRSKQREDRVFAVVATKIWKELPLQIGLAPTLPVLKSRLKTHLFSWASSAPV